MKMSKDNFDSSQEAKPFEQLIQSLSVLDNSDLVYIKDELSRIASENQIDVANATLEDLRKLASIYMHEIMVRSASH